MNQPNGYTVNAQSGWDIELTFDGIPYRLTAAQAAQLAEALGDAIKTSLGSNMASGSTRRWVRS